MAATTEQLLSSVKTPSENDKVYKEECMYCFDTPFYRTGLYVCMNKFYGLGRRFVEKYSEESGNRVFLHLRKWKKPKPAPRSDEPQSKKPHKLAIGVEGGFALNETQYETFESKSIVILPSWGEIVLDDNTMQSLPPNARASVEGILNAESAIAKEEKEAISNTWEGETREVSKYAETLEQLDIGKKIPPSGWKCEMCDLTTNLWLNLTDGAILCGRKYFDGTGGNNHAVDYYHETKYPLAVKLGTITPDGADVYSYAEDNMVIDPLLSTHLHHFGIDIMTMKQTEKTMVEMEIQYNLDMGEWNLIQESGSELKPRYGSGYVGMHNLGNSCYMNSVMQVLFLIPDFINKYARDAVKHFKKTPIEEVPNNFNCQMGKLGEGLLQDDYSTKPDPDDDTVYQNGIYPNSFKALIGRDHPEFSSKKQQDVHDFLLYFIKLVERSSKNEYNPIDTMRFKIEERLQCTESKCVKYTESHDCILSLNVPMDRVKNASRVEAYLKKKADLEAQGLRITDPTEVVRPEISLKSCLEDFAAAEMVPDYYSTALKRKTTVSKCRKLLTFPLHLFFHIKKFTVSENWTPKKLDISLDVPEILYLDWLKGQGRQEGEVDFPPDDREDQAEPPAPVLDEAIISQLVDMGFPLEACKKAVFNTQNSGVEPAMNWIMEHMEDPDFSSPFVPPGAKGAPPVEFVPSEEGINMIMSMGFHREQAIRALKKTNNNVERAADWIFSHIDELDQPEQMDSEDQTPPLKFRNGPPKYRLKAFISHMGTSADVGHYVAHIRRGEKWHIYNDDKVAESQRPPQDLGYIYLYERMSSF